MGESGSLTANPSESHLCFSPPHLRPFSSTLVPHPPPVKEPRRGRGKEEGSGEGVETEGTFSSGCFLWFRVWVNVSKPQGLAGPSLANTGGRARYLRPGWPLRERERDGEIFKPANGHRWACQNCENMENDGTSASRGSSPCCHTARLHGERPLSTHPSILFLSQLILHSGLCSPGQVHNKGTDNHPGVHSPTMISLNVRTFSGQHLDVKVVNATV